MKKVTITNATVIPFYNRNQNAPTEILKMIKPKSETFNSTICSFNVQTMVSDNPNRKAKLFEKCIFYANNDKQIEDIKRWIKNGALLQLEGYEDRKKGTDDKYYNNIIITGINPISENAGSDNVSATPQNEDDLPF